MLSISLTCGRRGLVRYLWDTHTSLFSLKSPPISIHLPLPVHRLKAISWAGPVIKSQAVVVGGDGGVMGADWLGRLQLESSSVCPVCFFQCSDCWPVLSQRALWKDRNVMLLLRHKLRWSLSAMLYLPSMIHPPPSTLLHLLLFYLSRETTGASHGVTAVSGMLGGHCSHFPGLHLHQETDWHEHHNQLGRAAQSKSNCHS